MAVMLRIPFRGQQTTALPQSRAYDNTAKISSMDDKRRRAAGSFPTGMHYEKGRREMTNYSNTNQGGKETKKDYLSEA